MQILPIKPRLNKLIVKHGLKNAYFKQSQLLEKNIRHPSLNVEKLEPKELEVYSFRLDKKYRVLFIFQQERIIEIIGVTTHYQ